MSARGYERYVRDLAMLARGMSRGDWGGIEADVHAALNGQASAELRSLLPLSFRRSAGAFFTSGPIRDRFSAYLANSDEKVYWDPTCGAGDLLLAASEHMELGATLHDTVKSWARRIRGQDLHEDFVEAARLRLFIAATARHRIRGDRVRMSAESGSRAFSQLTIGDGLHALRRARGSYEGHILLNPPFGSVIAEPRCSWSSGSTSQAGIFLMAAVEALADGGRLTGILPDVLRSGSRYRLWRGLIDRQLSPRDIEIYGQFDGFADIDVFFLQGRKLSITGDRSDGDWWPDIEASVRLGDRFEVGVGAVVDNRDPHEGLTVPYLIARDMPPSGEMGTPVRRRAFSGRVISPPFVAVRRTSAPASQVVSRARGVVITGDRSIAVDNHVITLKPKSGDLADCKKLLSVLESDRVANWLNERIRCRHLTVQVVRDLPWI